MTPPGLVRAAPRFAAIKAALLPLAFPETSIYNDMNSYTIFKLAYTVSSKRPHAPFHAREACSVVHHDRAQIVHDTSNLIYAPRIDICRRLAAVKP